MTPYLQLVETPGNDHQTVALRPLTTLRRVQRWFAQLPWAWSRYLRKAQTRRLIAQVERRHLDALRADGYKVVYHAHGWYVRLQEHR